MQIGPETSELLHDLYERAGVIEQLDGPQVEAWVSGLFAVFDDQVTAEAFVDYCAAQQSSLGQLVCAAIAELASGVDPSLAQRATRATEGAATAEAPPALGQATLINAWQVDAPFGATIILGFQASDGDSTKAAEQAGFDSAPDLSDQDESDDSDFDIERAPDGRHSILVEYRDGQVEDLQLAGSAKGLVQEVAASDSRVGVSELDVNAAVALIVEMWPPATTTRELGPGFEVNQYFVRRRLFLASGVRLPVVTPPSFEVDIRRGLSDNEYAEANLAALATLQAAVGSISDADASPVVDDALRSWVSVIHGDAAGLSPRERDGLLWLEWADWLGVGIGLLRADASAEVSGSAFVDLVNRCPEVSSTIDKRDRVYAEWAFDVAIDLLIDGGAVAGSDAARLLTPAGRAALGAAMVQAWSPAAG